VREPFACLGDSFLGQTGELWLHHPPVPYGEAHLRCSQVFQVRWLLFASRQPLPENLAEVLMRRDEIVYSERVRSDVRLRERISDFRNLVQEDNLEPEACQRLRQSPRFIQLMADTAPTMITRIVNEVPAGEPPFTDNDFSAPTIARHKIPCCMEALRGVS
jgi:Patatin phospholipase